MGERAPHTPGSYVHAHMYCCSCAFNSILLSVVHVYAHTLLQEYLKLCAHESGSVRLRSQTDTDRPTVHTGSNVSAPVWLRYPYQRGTDKKNGAVWLRSICLPCEPTDRIQKKVQIGNEANFLYKRGLSTFLHFSSWLRGMSTSKMYLSLIGSTWIRSRVHANS